MTQDELAGTDRARRRPARTRRGAAAARGARPGLEEGHRRALAQARADAAALQGVAHPHVIRLDDLVAVDEQKRAIDRNTKHFVAGLPANNVLLTGSRGTGKSSLVKAMLAKYAGARPAPHRSREGRLDRPSGHRRPRRQPPRALHRLLRRPHVRRRRLGLSRVEGDARRLDRRRRVQRADLRDVEPPPHAARVLQREPRDEARRRRSASGRVGRGKDLAVRTLRAVDLVLSVRPGRLPRGRRRLARALRRQVAGKRARRAGAHQGSAAVGALARLAQRPRGLAIREELRRRPPALPAKR